MSGQQRMKVKVKHVSRELFKSIQQESSKKSDKAACLPQQWLRVCVCACVLQILLAQKSK